MVRNELLRLIQAGLLVSATENEFADLDISASTISTLGIVTRDRASSLAECLRSYVHSSKHFSRDNQFAVFDNSTLPEVIEANKSLIRQLHTKYLIKFHYPS